MPRPQEIPEPTFTPEQEAWLRARAKDTPRELHYAQFDTLADQVWEGEGGSLDAA